MVSGLKVCFVQCNPVTDRGDLTVGERLDDGGGSRIVLQDRGGDQQLHVSDASAPTPGDEDSDRGECTLYLVGSMPTIAIAPHEREHEQGVPSDTTNGQIAHNAPDLDRSERGSEVQDRGECEDQGTTSGRPSAVAPDRTHDDDQPSGGASHTIQSGKSRGECTVLVIFHLLKLVSSRERLQGYSSWCHHHVYWCRREARVWIWFSQGCPGSYLCCLYQL